jgi:adenylyltransferase/sulfurtransferase
MTAEGRAMDGGDVMRTAQAARNRLWLEPETESALGRSHVTVIGVGGTGSLLAAALAHVGVRRLTLCDPDILDATSFNRWPFARPDRVGDGKAEALATYLRGQFPGITVAVVPERFPHPGVVAAAQEATLVVGCVDTAHDRIALDVFCRHAGRTLVDLGAGFLLDETTGRPRSASAQVFVSRPGEACLQCVGFFPGVEHGYLGPGTEAAEPSSYLLTSLVAALAGEVVLRELVDGFAGNLVTYDRETLVTTVTRLVGHPDCTVCGAAALAGLAHLGDADVLEEAM